MALLQNSVALPRVQARAPHSYNRRVLRIIVVAFIALGLLYNVTLPVFEASDEVAHYNAAAAIARDRRLPDLNLPLPSHESAQPPLYYVLAALVIAPFDNSNLAEISQLNPDWFDRDVNPDFISVTNLHVHGDGERFPYRGAVWGVRAARALSTALGALTIILVFMTARLAAPGTPAAAPLAAALTAFNPKFIHVASIVSNDIAIITAASAACYIICRVLSMPHARNRMFVAIGAFIGVATISKLGGLGLLLPAALLLLGAQRETLRRSALIGAGALAVCGPWLLHNTLAYGDPLAFERVRAANASLLRDAPLDLVEMPARIPAIISSYAAEIGLGLRLPDAVATLYSAMAALGALGLLWRLAQHAPGLNILQRLRTPAAALVVWQLALIALFLPWLRSYSATENGRLIMPGIMLVVIALARGSLMFVPEAARVRAVAACAGLLAIIAAAMPFTTITPAFATPETFNESTAQAAAAPDPAARDVIFDGKFRVLAAGLTRARLGPGEPIGVWLVWGALQPIEQSYRLQLEALDASGRVLASQRRIPFGGRFDTQRWTPGAYFRDTYTLPVEGLSTDPNAVAVRLSLFRIYGQPQRLKIDGSGADRLVLGHVKLPTALAIGAQPAHTAIAEFGGSLALDAATFTPAGVAFEWRVLKPPGADYTLFVHVLNAQGKKIAQHDGEPFQAQYPTGLWETGERVHDVRTFALPPEARRIRVGWYVRDGHRLPAIGAAGQRWQDDAVVIER